MPETEPSVNNKCSNVNGTARGGRETRKRRTGKEEGFEERHSDWRKRLTCKQGGGAIVEVGPVRPTRLARIRHACIQHPLWLLA